MRASLRVLRNSIYRRIAVNGPVAVGSGFHVGPGSRVWAPNHLSIGSDVYIGKWCTIEVDGTIGDGTLIANAVGIVGRRDHDPYWTAGPVSRAPWVGTEARLSVGNEVHIGRNVWIGYGAIILSGISIGDHAIVQAGSVVRSTVEANTIVGGAGATRVRQRYTAEALDAVEESLRRTVRY